MPESNKIKQDEVMVDLDTSGPDTEVNLPEEEIKTSCRKHGTRNSKRRNNRTRKRTRKSRNKR
jgi:hypothetical protein